jgi:hypothetical protein
MAKRTVDRSAGNETGSSAELYFEKMRLAGETGMMSGVYHPKGHRLTPWGYIPFSSNMTPRCDFCNKEPHQCRCLF